MSSGGVKDLWKGWGAENGRKKKTATLHTWESPQSLSRVLGHWIRSKSKQGLWKQQGRNSKQERQAGRRVDANKCPAHMHQKSPYWLSVGRRRTETWRLSAARENWDRLSTIGPLLATRPLLAPSHTNLPFAYVRDHNSPHSLSLTPAATIYQNPQE